MKKLVLALIVFVSILFVGCTDNSLEDLEKNNEIRKQESQLVDPSEVEDPGDRGN